ncbi:hypothetical protein BDV28DRAFT_149725 [Aspergillus coremiiformis]|uniref:Uncharacterized protein n=1 Tax=Aspergillus coremiiformis TaxID=138285 RepID=A0A5N6Z267_9EURO|nr:hypothetical protein BDV28DRAFT_149725 [Aspergillus coremiiformis]
MKTTVTAVFKFALAFLLASPVNAAPPAQENRNTQGQIVNEFEGSCKIRRGKHECSAWDANLNLVTPSSENRWFVQCSPESPCKKDGNLCFVRVVTVQSVRRVDGMATCH